MGNDVNKSEGIKHLGEAEEDLSEISETTSTSTTSMTTASGEEKKKSSSLFRMRWRGGSKKGGVDLKGEVKLVILGIAASGKSTFVRQVRTAHNNAYTASELQNYYQIICSNIWDGMKEVCIHMKKHNIDCAVPENSKRTRYFRELPAETPQLTEREIVRIKALWEDSAVQKCVEMMKSEDLAIHNFTYFMERIDEISKPNYVPTNKDVLYARQRSTGASECSVIHNKVRYTLVDMGGQRPERAKWDRALELGVNGIFFFVSVEEFDIQSTEEKGKTKFEISLQTWKELFDNENVMNKLEVFLIFNKIDLLEKKLQKNFKAFQTAFPNYKGDKSRKNAMDHIERVFCKQIPEYFTKPFTCLRCCALDPDLVGDVFNFADKYITEKVLPNEKKGKDKETEKKGKEKK
eukprot:TRINITY_DN2960_c0_g1_i1.p1 TRINITY_DN2960_c0_g1~~TRINITY_DN2960_c0_g1_i1.p1  ORF type:complete len:406 (-),score=120.17 TRINITY_DN2960_c0_g1_i1:56-1273(-)